MSFWIVVDCCCIAAWLSWALVVFCSINGAFTPAIEGMEQEMVREAPCAKAKSSPFKVIKMVSIAERRNIKETADFNVFFFTAHLR